MTKIVRITENLSGLVSEYTVDLPNPHATDKNYFDAAWRYAIDDSNVNPDFRSDFEFSISDTRYAN